MHERLLGRKDSHEVDEEEELLWNALNDTESSQMRQHKLLNKENEAHCRESEERTIREVPSLRSHVHLPAISSIFNDVAASFNVLWARKANGPRSIFNTHKRLKRSAPNIPDEDGNVYNLDGFLISLYNYYYQKGFWSIAMVEIVSLLTGFFSVCLSSFILGCVDWRHLAHCAGSQHRDKDKCQQDLEHYFVWNTAKTLDFYHYVIAFYFATFSFYWIFRSIRLAGLLQATREMSNFYKQRLHIDERQVQTIAWDEIVSRVLELVDSNNYKNADHVSSYRLRIDKKQLSTPLDFAKRILRRENYLIAIMNHQDIFHQKDNALPSSMHFASVSQVMFSRNMECNLSISLIDYMFDAENRLSELFLSDVRTLQKRFVVAGMINLVLTPFILLYRIFRFFFLSAQEWHMNRVHYFGTRRWSSYALWKFREYNELPHVLDARMARSYPLAEKYLSQFPPGSMAILAGGVSFCASSLMAVLLAASVVEESMLLEVTLSGRQLLWYLTIATGIFALSRTFTTSQSPFLLEGDCEEAMLELSAETHHFPKEWRSRCHHYETRNAFLSLFPYKATLFAQECISVIMAPYLLCITLPSHASDVLLFLRTHTSHLSRGGSFCRLADFDFKQYTNDLKLQSSFINFKQNHPKWIGAEQGEHLMQRLERHRKDEMEKSIRMGDTIFESQFLTASQQLLQSQAIHSALTKSPRQSDFYWFEKLQQQRADALGRDKNEDSGIGYDIPHSIEEEAV